MLGEKIFYRDQIKCSYSQKGDMLREHLVRMINESSIPQMSTVNYILIYISIYNITTFLKLKAFLLIFVIFLFQRIIQIIKLYIQFISGW